MRYLLTGNGYDRNGDFMLRSLVASEIRAYGDQVVMRPEDGYDVLVASRHDTAKAQSARALGKPIWSYADMWTYTLEGRQPRTSTIPAALRAGPHRVIPGTLRTGETRPAFRAPTPMAPVKPHPMPMGHILSDGRRMIDL